MVQLYLKNLCLPYQNDSMTKVLTKFILQYLKVWLVYVTSSNYSLKHLAFLFDLQATVNLSIVKFKSLLKVLDDTCPVPSRAFGVPNCD